MEQSINLSALCIDRKTMRYNIEAEARRQLKVDKTKSVIAQKITKEMELNPATLSFLGKIIFPR